MHASAPSPTKHVTTTFTPPMATQYTVHVDPTYTIQAHASATVTAVDASNAVRIDAWESGLCGCFSSCINCCMVWCLPCVSLAQISQRIGFAKYWHVLLALIGMYLLEFFISRFVLAASYQFYWYDYSVYDYDAYRTNHESSSYSSTFGSWDSSSYYYSDSSHDDVLYVSFAIVLVLSVIISFCTFLGTLTGVVLIIVTWALRSRVRSHFSIPGSCCGDCFASFCCSCCTVAQMATHVKTYKKGNCDFGPVDTLPAFLPQ